MCLLDSRMALETLRPIVRGNIYRFVVRIMAGATRKLAFTSDLTFASSQLLNVTDHFQSGFGRRIEDISGKYFFQLLSGLKVADLFPRIRDTHLAAEMTLFANAVSGSRREPTRIDNVLGRRSLQVLTYIAVAALAGDCLLRKSRLLILIQCFG